jgi:hypothetical protein
VLDGHHRVAVARALGQRWVLANITCVRQKSPDDGPGRPPRPSPGQRDAPERRRQGRRAS